MCMVSLPTADSLQTHWEEQHPPPGETGGMEEVWCSGSGVGAGGGRGGADVEWTVH